MNEWMNTWTDWALKHSNTMTGTLHTAHPFVQSSNHYITKWSSHFKAKGNLAEHWTFHSRVSPKQKGPLILLPLPMLTLAWCSWPTGPSRSTETFFSSCSLSCPGGLGAPLALGRVCLASCSIVLLPTTGWPWVGDFTPLHFSSCIQKVQGEKKRKFQPHEIVVKIRWNKMK